MATKIGAAKFKAECLKILDTLGPEGIVITKRGVPVATVMPIEKKTFADFRGCLRGHAKILGDIMSTGLKWSGDIENIEPGHAHPRLPSARRNNARRK